MLGSNYFASVGAVVLRGSEVLLVRHTYGAAAGKLLNPGGYIEKGELPMEAVRREVLEETGVVVEPVGMLSIRCSAKDWYMVFVCEYVSGEPFSDMEENNEALFMDCGELLKREDATDTVKLLVRLALERNVLSSVECGKDRVMFVGDVLK